MIVVTWRAVWVVFNSLWHLFLPICDELRMTKNSITATSHWFHQMTSFWVLLCGKVYHMGYVYLHLAFNSLFLYLRYPKKYVSIKSKELKSYWQQYKEAVTRLQLNLTENMEQTSCAVLRQNFSCVWKLVALSSELQKSQFVM